MKGRMWSEFNKTRTINTGDGFITVRENQVVVIFVAEPNEPIVKFFVEALEKAAKIPTEEP